MRTYDHSQQQVLQLDPQRHARVLGAPGSGKTSLLVESYLRFREQEQWSEEDLLVIAPRRLTAAELRQRIEHRSARALAGTPVRTPVSLAFAVLQRSAALRGEQTPRLLTGTAHDEIIEAEISMLLGAGRDKCLSELGLSRLPFAEEVLRSAAFRAELREMSRVLDDAAIDPAALPVALQLRATAGDAAARQWDEPWRFGAYVLARAAASLAQRSSVELAASTLTRRACAVIRDDAQLRVPKLVLLDDAAEIGEGTLALLAALAERGTRLWVFGDPDTATGVFQGEHTRVLAGLSAELQRRGARSDESEQLVILDTVYRHGVQLRNFVAELSTRVGVLGGAEQRQAKAAEPAASTATEAQRNAVTFAIASSAAEQLSMVAHRFRAAHLGVGGQKPRPWADMAVICRSRADVTRVSRQLAAQQVPTAIAAGGVVLREQQLVRELVQLLQHVLGIVPLDTSGVLALLGGVLGGLDPIAVRRLRATLRLHSARMLADNAGGKDADVLVSEAFNFPGEQPVIDTRAARRLRRLGVLAAGAKAVHAAGGTAREVLWHIWEGSGLAPVLQTRALEGRGLRADTAHRELDAVMALFFALQRHEEQASDRPIAELLEELLLSTVPVDSLAATAARDVVTVTTPQGAIGREFDVVCVLGVQDGSWPNLRTRGSFLGVPALERWFRGELATQPSRRDTMHDELRLFIQAVSRARSELVVISISNEDQHPGPFFGFGRQHLSDAPLPSTSVTLRGLTAQMRRRLVTDHEDQEARDTLILLARAGVPGAHPDEWYGALPVTTTAPLVDLDNDPEATVSVSPSQLERAETCPLDWILSRLGGGLGDVRAGIGTLLHRALETAPPGASGEEIFAQLTREWGSLRFEAEWQELRALHETRQMSEAIAEYLADFANSEQQLLASESSFRLRVGVAQLRGNADRIELRTGSGEANAETSQTLLTVVDLKTGKYPPSAEELRTHAQLQAYQLGAMRGAFTDARGNTIEAADTAGAQLLYIHPNVLRKEQRDAGKSYRECTQPSLTPEAVAEFEQRVQDIARVMAAASFQAEVEHHCTNSYAGVRACALHIIPAVSYA